ncbi:MAG: hypothetical protein QF673_01885 [Candidatus Hydrothermarchaeota archaeon]|nr:hypothetical protein [Candidatus Hydrothermarchaeota archaeon]
MAGMESVEDLQVFLRLHGIKARPEKLRTLWGGMKKPIVVDETKGGGDDNLILQIVKVWERDNKRIVLWNDRRLAVHYPGYHRVYDYMDEGRYLYRGVLLLFDEMSEGVIKDIRRYWSKLPLDFGNYWRDYDENLYLEDKKITLTYREFLSLIQRCERTGGTQLAYDSEEAKAWLRGVNDASGKGLEEVRVYDNYIRIGDLKFGIVGIKLWEYIIPLGNYDCPFHGPNDNPGPAAQEYVTIGFFHGVEELRAEGVYTLWLGRYTAKLRIQLRNKCLIRYLEGVRVRSTDFIYAMEKALEHDKQGYRELVRELWRTPRYVSELKEDGADFVVVNGGRWRELSINIRFERVNRKWHVVSPLDDELFYLPGGIHRVKRLVGRGYFLDGGYSSFYEDIYDLYQVLIDILPGEHVIRIFDVAREEQRRAEKKSRRLLKETLMKYPERVKDGTFRPEDRMHHRGELRGYVVKGERRNYFLDKHDHRVYTYPEGRYVCIVDDHWRGMTLPSLDKLVSRMYLLMNDGELEAEVETLRHRDELVLRAA